MRQINLDLEKESTKIKEQLDNDNHKYSVMTALQTRMVAKDNQIDEQ